MFNSRASALRWLTTCATTAGLMASLVAPISAQAAGCAGEDLIPDASNTAQVADATLCLINAERAAAGLGAVAADAALSSASTAYARDMTARKFFAHESPEGGTLKQRLANVSYGFQIAGENIAWGEGGLATPAQIVDAWMHSEAHRTNILDGGYRQIGLGIVAGTPHQTTFNGATYVTDFGTPEAAPKAASSAAHERASLHAHAGSARHRPVAHFAVQRKHVRRAHRHHARRPVGH